MLSWLRSWLFWKILGIYFLLSTLALAGLILALSHHLASGGTDLEIAVGAAVVAWLCGIVGFVFVSISVVTPLQMLRQVMNTAEPAADRKAMLNRLIARQDEFGDTARALRQINSDLDRKRVQWQQRERELNASATQLSAILQAMVEGVVAVDEHERILFANRVASSMLELDSRHAAGRPLFEAVRNSHLLDAVRQALNSREANTVEFRLSRNDSQVSLLVSPIADGGAVLVLSDVTEVRRLEAMRRDFVSGVSHELKTPLTVIQACTETLLDGALDDEQAGIRFLRQIEEQSERLLQLILGMLQLARLESGEQVFDEEPVDLSEVGSQVIASMQPVAAGKQISLSLNGESELFVLGDFQAIRTVTSNLVDNALKYTPDGGTVNVELVAGESANTLRVIDTGVGIPRKDHDRVFERFYRVERDRNRERGGTGLGLSIVKHLCQAMKAEVTLHSEAGKGATIEVCFPFHD